MKRYKSLKKTKHVTSTFWLAWSIQHEAKQQICQTSRTMGRSSLKTYSNENLVFLTYSCGICLIVNDIYKETGIGIVKLGVWLPYKNNPAHNSRWQPVAMLSQWYKHKLRRSEIPLHDLSNGRGKSSSLIWAANSPRFVAQISEAKFWLTTAGLQRQWNQLNQENEASFFKFWLITA